MTVELTNCPACGDDRAEDVETFNGYDIVRCQRCALEYTRNPIDAVARYDLTYAGGAGVLQDPRPYASPGARLALERQALFLPQPRLSSAERWVLRQIEETVPSGATVLDVGCGTGRFLRALRSRGFHAAGIDPADEVVRDLRELGLDASVGSAPDFPWEAPPPSAVTLFEVLEHMSDPVGILSALRRRFPQTAIGATVPSPLRPDVRAGKRGATDYPPNHFLRWTAVALEEALRRAGYTAVHVETLPPEPAEFVPGFGDLVSVERLRRLRPRSVASANRSGSSHGGNQGTSTFHSVLATAVLIAHRVWTDVAQVGGLAAASRARRGGASGVSLAIWARP